MTTEPTPDVLVDAPTAEEVTVYEGGVLSEALPTVVKESKAGHKTTEFWLTVATSVLVVLNGIPLPEKYEGIVVAALAAVYAISRGLAKQGIPDIEPGPTA